MFVDQKSRKKDKKGEDVFTKIASYKVYIL